MQHQPESKFRVAIIGGGISGAALAATFSVHHPSIHYDIFERGPSFDTLGAGVGLTFRTKWFISFLGLGDALEDVLRTRGISGNLEGSEKGKPVFKLRRSDKEVGYDLADLDSHIKSRLHRADLLNLLTSLIPKSNVHFNHTLSSYDQPSSSSVTMTFTNGESYTADILIACDGWRSSVRRQLFRSQPEYLDAQWTGQVSYRGVIPSSVLPPTHTVFSGPLYAYCGLNGVIIAYPVRQGEMVNIAAQVTQPNNEDTMYRHGPERKCGAQTVVDAYPGWEEEVQTLLKSFEGAAIWPIYTVKPLPYYAKGRIALVGDAAHSMEPYLGHGANSAIDDVVALSAILGSPQCTHSTLLPLALRAYSDIRTPHANHVASQSRANGQLVQFKNGMSGQETSEEEVVEGVQALLEWARGEDDDEPHLAETLGYFERMVRRGEGEVEARL